MKATAHPFKPKMKPPSGLTSCIGDTILTLAPTVTLRTLSRRGTAFAVAVDVSLRLHCTGLGYEVQYTD
eukprot:881032-Rhodomonas_salina.1